MDHLKAIEGLLTFHHTEIERLEIARKVILELDRRMEDRVAAKRAAPKRIAAKSAGKSGSAAPKPLTFVKKANGHHGVADIMPAGTAKERIVELLSTEPGLESAAIQKKLGLAGSTQAKQRVYTALYDLKRNGKVALENHRYRLAAA